MNIVEWSKSEVDYGRKLVDSAVAGARDGEGQFLKEESLRHHLERSAIDAVVPAILGACLGWLGGHLEKRQSSKRALVSAFLGGAVGFGASLIWENRDLTARMATGAWKNVNKARDAHWFERNPIDYA
ncbi:MAG TPA: hypothetical protein VGS27_29540 [Candidatus Sulfotelmatobacter sp.]|nr:hypothetical protein [Candidatus Sulfotelmatobacter sp.]